MFCFPYPFLKHLNIFSWKLQPWQDKIIFDIPIRKQVWRQQVSNLFGKITSIIQSDNCDIMGVKAGM